MWEKSNANHIFFFQNIATHLFKKYYHTKHKIIMGETVRGEGKDMGKLLSAQFFRKPKTSLRNVYSFKKYLLENVKYGHFRYKIIL